MVDVREFGELTLEEVIRTAVDDAVANSWHAMPAMVTEDSKEGHVTTLQPTVNGKFIDQHGKTTYEPYPALEDAPVHHVGGGQVVHTTPSKKGDEVLAVFGSRAGDSWFQSGGASNNPVDSRFHHMSDAFMLKSYRSTPRKLKKVAKESSQIRAEDLSQYHDLHPTNGWTHFASDPKDNKKKHTHIGNKDKGVVSTSSANVQHIVENSSTTIVPKLIRHIAPKIFLN
jgi:hypothetical protein